MKLLAVSKRYILLGASSFLLISLFQNCGQPGTIAISDDQALTDLNDNASPTPPPPVVDTTAGPQFKDYQKTVTVNASGNKVDVLVVIDNSGSMSLEQASMAQRFSSFMGKLQGLDWQVGIVTTDVREDLTNSALKDGRLLSFSGLNSNLVKSSDDFAKAQSEFAKVIQRPANEGSGNEQGVKATYRALERSLDTSGPNVGLIRQGAALSVILVSDADETVGGNSIAGDPNSFGDKNKTENLLSFINTRFPGKTFKFNSIIVRDGDLNCLKMANSGNEGYGKNYQKLTTATSGVLGSVCEADYGNQLSVIGDSTTELVKLVTLDCAPGDSNKDGKADLTITGVNGATLSGYSLSGRMVTFDQALAVGSYNFSYRCEVLASM